jgi:RNA polymerase sigma-70 factor (ECF subfamily)
VDQRESRLLDVSQVSQEYFARIHRAALVLCGNPWDADDLTQETFLVLTRSRQAFEGRSSLYTWLYGILLNLERRERRRAGLRRRKLRVVWDNEPPDQRTTPAAETPIEVAEWKRSLWSVVAQLPDGQRQALVLRYSEHLRYDEIAKILRCPLGTVKSRIFNAMVSLRELIAADAMAIREAPQHPAEDLARAL